MTQNETNVLKKAIETWGKMPQVLMVLEEMSELQKEILKNINRGRDNKLELIDEIADVEIMLAQLKIIYDIEADVQNHIPVKIEKIRKRLEA